MRKAKKKENNVTATGQEVRVLIGVPLERSIHQLAFLGFLAIAQQGFPFIRMYYGRTDLIRNKMGEQLLKSPFTHLLMLDADHIHPADIVIRLVNWVVKFPEVKVVGGLNFRRGEPYDPCCFLLGSDGQYYPPAQWEPGLMEVDALGTGSILIAREVFEAGPEPWFYNDYSKCTQDIWPGEDMGFAKFCRDHGFKQFVDTTLTSPHIIDNLVDESVFRAYLVDHPHKVMDWDATVQAPTMKSNERSAAVQIPEMVTRVEA